MIGTGLAWQKFQIPIANDSAQMPHILIELLYIQLNNRDLYTITLLKKHSDKVFDSEATTRRWQGHLNAMSICGRVRPSQRKLLLMKNNLFIPFISITLKSSDDFRRQGCHKCEPCVRPVPQIHSRRVGGAQGSTVLKWQFGRLPGDTKCAYERIWH
jgi:hypothetical protein